MVTMAVRGNFLRHGVRGGLPWRWNGGVFLFAVLVLDRLEWVSSEDRQDATAAGLTVDQVFDPNSGEVYLQRKYVVSVPAKSEECYFIDDVLQGQKLNFHYLVVSAGKSGQQMDVTVRVRGPPPNKSIIYFSSRRVEGQLLGNEAKENGDVEICFINRFSMFEPKRIFWQFEVEGAPDTAKVLKLIVNDTVTEFLENSDKIHAAVRGVRQNISKTRHQQWWLGSISKKHESRLEALKGMIDRWSMGHGILVVVVGIGQVFYLKKFFEAKATPHKISTRA